MYSVRKYSVFIVIIIKCGYIINAVCSRFFVGVA